MINTILFWTLAVWFVGFGFSLDILLGVLSEINEDRLQAGRTKYPVVVPLLMSLVWFVVLPYCYFTAGRTE